ncbi:hypothetical protein EON81_09320 [bacterium]|nr:MAG: hypothetical protein EON81_09320 [bacterium]
MKTPLAKAPPQFAMLTNAEVAESIGVPEASIEALNAGEFHPTLKRNAAKIALGLGVDKQGFKAKIRETQDRTARMPIDVTDRPLLSKRFGGLLRNHL